MPDPQIIHTLKTSKQPRDLARAAQVLGASAKSEDHDALMEFLESEEFLLRLDPPEMEEELYTDQRVAKPLRSLAENEAPTARAALVKLMETPVFTDSPLRTDLLIDASVHIRPATDRVIAFWKKCADPDGGHIEPVASATLHNGSEPALKYFEVLVVNDRYEYEVRRSWLRRHVLLLRNEEAILLMGERLIESPKSPADISGDFVDALFDYRPSEWYRAHSVVSPPPRAAAGGKARVALRRIAGTALDRLKLNAQRRSAVETTLKELDAIEGKAGKDTPKKPGG